MNNIPEGFKLVPVELIARAIAATMTARGPGSPTERDLRAILTSPEAPAPADAKSVDALLLSDCVEHLHSVYGGGYFGTEVVTLYTHPDAGEVEQFPHGSEAHKAVFMALESYGGGDTFEQGVIALAQQSRELKKERDTLRAQLAERDALLREADDFMYAMTGNDTQRDLDAKYGRLKWEDAICELRGRVATTLSTTAKPEADHD